MELSEQLAALQRRVELPVGADADAAASPMADGVPFQDDDLFEDAAAAPQAASADLLPPGGTEHAREEPPAGEGNGTNRAGAATHAAAQGVSPALGGGDGENGNVPRTTEAASSSDDDDDVAAFRIQGPDQHAHPIGGDLGMRDAVVDPNDPDGLGDEDDPVLPLYGESDYEDEEDEEEEGGSGEEMDDEQQGEQAKPPRAQKQNSQRRREAAAAARAADDAVAAERAANRGPDAPAIGSGLPQHAAPGGAVASSVLVDEYVANTRAAWTVDRLPTLQFEAPEYWSATQRAPDIVTHWRSETERLENIVGNMKRELSITHQGAESATEVSRACSVLEPTLRELWDVQYKVAISQADEPPPVVPRPAAPPRQARGAEDGVAGHAQGDVAMRAADEDEDDEMDATPTGAAAAVGGRHGQSPTVGGASLRADLSEGEEEDLDGGGTPPPPRLSTASLPTPPYLTPGAAVEVRLESLPGLAARYCWLEGTCLGLVDACDDDGNALSWQSPEAQARVAYPQFPTPEEQEDCARVRPRQPQQLRHGGGLRGLLPHCSMPGALIEVRKGPTGAGVHAPRSWVRAVVLSVSATYPTRCAVKISAQHMAACRAAGDNVWTRLCAAGARAAEVDGDQESRVASALIAVPGDKGLSSITLTPSTALHAVAGRQCVDSGASYDVRVAADFDGSAWHVARTDTFLLRSLRRSVGATRDEALRARVVSSISARGVTGGRTAVRRGVDLMARVAARGPTACNYKATINALTAAVRDVQARSGTAHDIPPWLNMHAQALNKPAAAGGPSDGADSDGMDSDLRYPTPTGTVWALVQRRASRRAQGARGAAAKAPPSAPKNQPAAAGPSATVYNASAQSDTPLFSGSKLRKHPESQEPVMVLGALAKELKPHQWEGVRFMWENLVDVFFDFEGGQQPGCVLAHSMGLGKTLQVLALLHTLLRHEPGTRVLVLAPKNVLANWVAEFEKWLPTESTRGLNRSRLLVLGLKQSETTTERLNKAKQWDASREAGAGMCMLMSTSLFSSLVAVTAAPEQAPELYTEAGPATGGAGGEPMEAEPMEEPVVEPLLTPVAGPIKKAARIKAAPDAAQLELASLLAKTADFVVLDEAHEIRNVLSQRSVSASKLSTPRRLALTGSPLQNNLRELWAMMEFVRPSDMGTYEYFKTDFVEPIEAGRQPEATSQQIRMMKRTLGVLWDMTEAYVQRKDDSPLKADLPPMTDAVLRLAASPLQHALLACYLNAGKSCTEFELGAFVRLVFDRPQALLDKCVRVAAAQASLGAARAAAVVEDVARQVAAESQPMLGDEDDELPPVHGLPTPILDALASPPPTMPAPSAAPASTSAEKKTASRAGGGAGTGTGPKDDIAQVFRDVPFVMTLVDTFRQFGYNTGAAGSSSATATNVPCAKIWAVVEIARWCAAHEEKLLVFSQYVQTLDCVHAALQHSLGWKTGTPAAKAQAYRIDGDVAADRRQNLIDAFNTLMPKAGGAHCFLLSTKAGCMGINLTAATRCVVLDQGWNPTFTTQAIHRCYRYGQTKPTHVYRLVAHAWKEDRIYGVAAGKEELALRVVDKAPMSIQDRGRDGMRTMLPPASCISAEDQSRLREWAAAHTDGGLLTALAAADASGSTSRAGGPWLVSATEHKEALRTDVQLQLTAQDRANAAMEYISSVDPTFKKTARHQRLLARQAARDAMGSGEEAGPAAVNDVAVAALAVAAAARPQRRETQPLLGGSDDDDGDEENVGGMMAASQPAGPPSASQAVASVGGLLRSTGAFLAGLTARLTPQSVSPAARSCPPPAPAKATLEPPPNPFSPASEGLKCAAYEVLKTAGADGMVIDDIMATLNAAGKGHLVSVHTPEASFVAALNFDVTFCKPGVKRYALAFLHYGGRIPPMKERQPTASAERKRKEPEPAMQSAVPPRAAPPPAQRPRIEAVDEVEIIDLTRDD